MIVQLILTSLLGGLLLYAAKEARKSPAVSVMTVTASVAGLYVVWVPSNATTLAEWAGVGRGADLILYVWAAISLIIMLNLHLKLRGQLELITALARRAALLNARHARVRTRMSSSRDDPSNTSGSEGSRERASRLQGYGPKGLRHSAEGNRPLKIRRISDGRSKAEEVSN